MKKVIVLASLALLLGGALLLQTGCPQPLAERGRDQTGWQIRLNVQAPVSAMAIEVGEYEVTGLLIELYDPQGELLRSIEWEATEGPRSYTVAVQERGQYQISVTHYGEKDGQTVEATESAAFNIQAMRITVIDIVPGAIGVIGVDPGELEPEAYDLTGYWDAYLLMNGDRDGPYLFYFVQTGNTLDGFNTTGTVEGSVVTLSIGSDEDDAVTIVGTIENNDYFAGPLDFYGELIAAEFRRVDDLQFGTLQLSGLVNFQSDKALGGEEPDYTEYFLRFQIKAGNLEGEIQFLTYHVLAAGQYYDVFDGRGHLGDDEVEVYFFDYGTWDDFRADGGWLVLDQYNPDGVVSGSFEVYFEDSDNWLGASFWLDQPNGSGAQVTITGGEWNGFPVENGNTDGLSWNSGEEFNHGPRYVAFIDEYLVVELVFQPQDGMAVGSFAVPDEMEVCFGYTLEGSEGMYEDRSVSGTVVVETYQEGVGMSGYFSGVQFADTSGSLAGSFDVTFELNGRMIVAAD